MKINWVFLHWKILFLVSRFTQRLVGKIQLLMRKVGSAWHKLTQIHNIIPPQCFSHLNVRELRFWEPSLFRLLAFREEGFETCEPRRDGALRWQICVSDTLGLGTWRLGLVKRVAKTTERATHTLDTAVDSGTAALEQKEEGWDVLGGRGWEALRCGRVLSAAQAERSRRMPLIPGKLLSCSRLDSWNPAGVGGGYFGIGGALQTSPWSRQETKGFFKNMPRYWGATSY